jgi:hypothetical protein
MHDIRWWWSSLFDQLIILLLLFLAIKCPRTCENFRQFCTGEHTDPVTREYCSRIVVCYLVIIITN